MKKTVSFALKSNVAVLLINTGILLMAAFLLGEKLFDILGNPVINLLWGVVFFGLAFYFTFLIMLKNLQLTADEKKQALKNSFYVYLVILTFSLLYDMYLLIIGKHDQLNNVGEIIIYLFNILIHIGMVYFLIKYFSKTIMRAKSN